MRTLRDLFRPDIAFSEPKPAGGAADGGGDPLGRVDLCFVIDTTGSMGAFLSAAQRHLIDAMEALRAEASASGDGGLDLRVALVEYRDHPPQERSFVTRAHPLTADLGVMRRVIDRLRAEGGGDAPEVVFDGLIAAVNDTAWRPHSLRFALLVGDAPPQGAQAHEKDGAKPCACGATLHTVTAAAEAAGVTVHALNLTRSADTERAFTALAQGTGGVYAHATPQGRGNVVEAMQEVLRREFGRLPLDRAVLTGARRLGGAADTSLVAEALGLSRAEAAASLVRLGKRGLLDALLPSPLVAVG